MAASTRSSALQPRYSMSEVARGERLEILDAFANAELEANMGKLHDYLGV